jgi:vesicular inhibitory amino acid transporter
MVLKCCAVVEARQGAGAAPCGYEAVAGAAFGGAGRALVSAVMYAELLGLCCCYLVLEVRAGVCC